MTPVASKPFLLHSKEDLRAYRRFPKIYGEMKYARTFVGLWPPYSELKDLQDDVLAEASSDNFLYGPAC